MIDFNALTELLKPKIKEILIELLPGGTLKGNEYMCANNLGGCGDSLRYNVQKCTGSDFASGETYGGPLDLYSKLKHISLPLAAEELAVKYHYNPDREVIFTKSGKAIQGGLKPLPPKSEFYHPGYGNPSGVWSYSDLFKMARYETSTGKQFSPWTRLDTNSPWEQKAPPAPRPLYNIEELKSRPADPVLVVEGEKCVESAKTFSGHEYVVCTWPNGASAVKSADWSLLSGRSVTIWPDNDAPGLKAAEQIQQILSTICPLIQTIDVSGQPKGWDAAESGFDSAQFNEWAWPRIRQYNVVAVEQINPDTTITQQSPTAIAVAAPNSTATAVNVIVQTQDEPKITGTLMMLWQNLGLALSKDGHPFQNLSNVVCILENEPYFRDNLWWDEFYLSALTNSNGQIIKIDDNYMLNLRLRIQRYYGLSKITSSDVCDAVALVARRVTRNDPRDYMDGLVWDKKKRLESFFPLYLGTEENDYTKTAGKNFWVSLCARVYDPGCIMRTMVVLKSKQWTGKSTAFSIIGGKWYTEVLENIHGNNFLQSLNGHLLLEFSDLAGFVRADINRIKQIISCRKDTYRAPYDRTPATHYRQCVFVATTNEDDFLRDDTGNTRFWPIETGTINLEKLKLDRNQLFAEAVQLYKNGENWHIMPEETAQWQERFRQVDEWESIINEYLINKEEVTTKEVAIDCLKFEKSKLEKFSQMRIARTLTTIGWKKKMLWRDGKAVRSWVRNLTALPSLTINNDASW